MPIPFRERMKKIINVLGGNTAVANAAMVVSPVPAGGQVTLAAGLSDHTRFNVAHGLGYAPRINSIRFMVIPKDDDTEVAYTLGVVKTDSTNVVVKPNATVSTDNVSFLMIIDLDKDAGGRNVA